MMLPCCVALIYGEPQGKVFFLCALLCLLLGLLFGLFKPKQHVFYAKEGLITVSCSWILLSLMGALPFYLSKDIPSYLDALFEIISGFTTTGASILSDVEALSHTSLFWRSFSHWVGGMGILIFMLSLMPAISDSSFQLMRAESPGPSVGKLTPKLRTTATYLYGIYLGLTLLLVVLLLCGGMNLFDSLTLSFGTAGTGGFGVLNSSFGTYSPYVQTVTAVFMLLFSLNFNLYYLILFRKIKVALKSEELHWFLAIVFLSVLLIFLNVRSMYASAGTALRDVFFQVSSIISTSGFSSTDFNLWPEASKTILLLLMFLGACAGSTGGGFKISRIVILFKAMRREFYSYLHPHSVTAVTFEDKPLSTEVIRRTLVYLAVYAVVFIVSLLIVSFDSVSWSSAFSGVAACINNIGPGFGELGPTKNYGFLNPLSKIVLMFDMLAGRLELYPMLMLFIPSVWKGSHKHMVAPNIKDPSPSSLSSALRRSTR
jgi:trk system potassium uptake protein TrkH